MGKPDILLVRESFHKFLDPIWQSGRQSRESLYQEMSNLLGRDAHVAQMSLDEIQKCAAYFLDKDSEGYPCFSCKNCIAVRHFIPVCLLKQQRKESVCGKFTPDSDL